MPLLTLQADDGGRVVVYRHGAHVASWITPDGTEQLFLSRRAVLDGRTAIRGGVPVIFPQFASEGSLPKHGFARTMAWELVESVENGPAPYAIFQLCDSAETRAVWPRRFVAAYRVALQHRALRLELTIENPEAEPMEFTAALHTYLRLDDASGARLRGLRGLRYRDSAAGGTVRDQDEPELAIRGEVNRIYLDVPGPVEVVDGGRTIRSVMHGFQDIVVWNPGREGEAALGDLEPGGSAHMVCVEAAAVGMPVHVPAGASWTGVQELDVR